ncbi:hypothetical protein FLONG3_7232 [Fusarium longipes]|uniref:Cryptochrome DASH n=1 Tax=Fusarium longipes TaxID=694270 RepID=A0A395SF85_9HYPO|nr:hypothetical protein FLONG3_7232 [Fusarium longipes]
MAGNKLLVYLLRRDLRSIDNPILHHLATTDHGFTHLLPIYVLPPHQIETSGFVAEGQKSPYPLAKSRVAGFWRCGPLRAKFQAECIWDVKQNFENIGSGILVRVGKFDDVLNHLIESLQENNQSIDTVWMTEEPSKEEVDDQQSVASLCSSKGIKFKLWQDEKYFIDDRDTGLKSPQDLPDVFTTYRKSQEPLRERPRPSLPRPQAGSLPPFPSSVPPQHAPFEIPDDYDEFVRRLLDPIDNMIPDPPPFPEGAKSAHPFKGGENPAWERLYHLIKSGSATIYQETRNGLLGTDYSTKLSAFLAMGTISARSIHDELVKFEDGTEQSYSAALGFAGGENEGTRAIRFELLWRDFFRLCTMKYGVRLFSIHGLKGAGNYDTKWKMLDDPGVRDIFNRWLNGTTGMGLIDASQRELYHTGYTSNRARQNVASFLAKHLSIDWRLGAEMYESNLLDYDTSSNWHNWQYLSSVGLDPRQSRAFNPVKQAFDYDSGGSFTKAWVEDVRPLEDLCHVFQLCTAGPDQLAKFGLTDNIMVTNPLKRIEFEVNRKPRGNRRPYRWKRGQGRGGRGGGREGSANGSGNSPSNGDNNRNSHHGQYPPESNRQFNRSDPSSTQNRNNWSSRGNNMSWRGNSTGYMSGHNSGHNSGRGGYMAPSFQQGFDYNHLPSRQYMAGSNYSHNYIPQAYHHQLPPHM